MDWRTFSVEMVSHLSWPVTLLLILFLARNRLEDLLPRLEKFKHDKTEISFYKNLDDIAKKANSIKSTDSDLNEYFKGEKDRLRRSADIAPHAVIHQAYCLLDKELFELYEMFFTSNQRERLTIGAARTVRHKLGFGADLEENIKELAEIREYILHNRKFSENNLKFDDVYSYVDLAIDTAMKVRDFKANKQFKSDS
ncbi:hypothetical protein QNZ88_004616 [Vibrio parahaemolyticus]|nr:hypothetical protein [Vibrio parahaemolyticus]